MTKKTQKRTHSGVEQRGQALSILDKEMHAPFYTGEGIPVSLVMVRARMDWYRFNPMIEKMKTNGWVSEVVNGTRRYLLLCPEGKKALEIYREYLKVFEWSDYQSYTPSGVKEDMSEEGYSR